MLFKFRSYQLLHDLNYLFYYYVGDCFHGGSLNKSAEMYSHRRLHGYLTIGRHAINPNKFSAQGWGIYNTKLNRIEDPAKVRPAKQRRLN